MTKLQQDGAMLPKGAYGDFSKAMSYGDYLKLETLLSAQNPQTREHDEVLFILIHQVSELWMKLIIHEVGAAQKMIRVGSLRQAFKMLSRICAVLRQLIQSWEVLSTLTSADYLRFRDGLGHSSGFQSYQYREIEYRLGNKNKAMLKPHEHRKDLHDRLLLALKEPSIYDDAIAVLARGGLPIDAEVLNRDFSQNHTGNESVRMAWLTVYKDTGRYWDLYELAEKLIDVEDFFQQWRFRHLKTVSRVIGMRRGTGGTDGVPYLQAALNYCFFPELWDVRTLL